MKITPKIVAGLVVTACALTLTACAPSGPEGDARTYVDNVLSGDPTTGQTSVDYAGDNAYLAEELGGVSCEVTGSSFDAAEFAETGTVPVTLECAGEERVVDVEFDSSEKVTGLYW